MTEFNDLGLKQDILFALKKSKLKTPTEVQQRIIPLALAGKNIVFTSRTGSGKTLAYTLGFLGKINKKQSVQMIVLVPTRELCIQVGKELTKICSHLNINVGMLYGGRSTQGDYKTLSKKNHILVGTPGRLLLHINEKSLKVGEVKFLVFDESDQMFDQGFFDDCVYLQKRVSKNVQILLSSATITKKVKQFIGNQIPNHEFLEIGEQISKNIIQEKVFCKKKEKLDLLSNIILKKKFKKTIVFCNTKQKSYDIAEHLNNIKINAKSLSGDLDQKERLNHLNLFKDGKIDVLVTTDVAARGIHVKNISNVINFDVPTRDEFYVHRIGRTGRLNKKGYSLTIICPEDEERFENIEFDYDLKIKIINKDDFLIV